MDAPGIQIAGLTLTFGTRVIFENLALDIPGGRITALLGTSGVGKSSLLKILAGLAYASQG
jgi:putative hydroxymethylpyrimidine transport system ATP-binding protein